MPITRWPKTQPPTEAELREIIIREGLFCYDWSNEPGDVYPAHRHDYDKVLYVARGSIVWRLPDTHETIETRAGDRIDLPRGTVHAAVVGPDGVTCYEGQKE
jgi:quercetin dioxygenase-like cupin family protein